MYEHLYQTVHAMQSATETLTQVPIYSPAAIPLHTPRDAVLKMGNIEEATNKVGIGNQINRNSVQIPGLTNLGTSVNRVGNSSSDSLTNNYILDQKLRNSGLYSKMKNKTMYSKSDIVREHAMLNSGIL